MIYLKFKTPPKTIKAVLRKLFSHKVGQFQPYFKSTITYSDPECTQIECKADKYRSVDDIVDIVHTYFPDATEKEIFNTLIRYRVRYKGRNHRIRLVNCNDIKRPTVFFYDNEPIVAKPFEARHLVNSRYKNWKTVCKIAGIKSKKELDKIFENAKRVK